MLSLILAKAGSTDNCQVVGLIMNRGLKKCEEGETDLWEAVKFSLGSSDHTSFSQIDTSVTKPWISPLYEYAVVSVRGIGGVEKISSKIVEMLLFGPLISAFQPEWPTLVNSKNKVKFNDLVQYNDFAKTVNFEHFIPRLMRDNLPGYFLGKFQDSDPQDEGIIQLISSRKYSSSQGAHFGFYLLGSEVKGETSYDVNLVVRGFSGKPELSDFSYIDFDYKVRITRKEALIEFKVIRGTNEVPELTEVFQDTEGPADYFIHCSLTIGAGVLYFKDYENVRARFYETLTLLRLEGPTKRMHHNFDTDLLIKKLSPVNGGKSMVHHIYMKASLSTNPPNSENRAGVRVTALTQTRGIYPALLISSRDIQKKFPTCFFTLYKQDGCMSMAMITGPNKYMIENALTDFDQRAVSQNNHNGAQSKLCRVLAYHKYCLIPQIGYITNLEPGLISMVSSVPQSIKIQRYEAMKASVKASVVEFENNVKTKYLVTCPYSCKKLKLINVLSLNLRF